MTSSEEHLTVTVPLPPLAHHIAEKFWEDQENVQKSNEVFLNTLAVYAVHSYLWKLDIETDLVASDSWNHTMHSCMNVADLEVVGLGKLECRPVWSEAQFCPIPLEVRENRIGYVVVRISESLTEAKILGFSKNALTDNLEIDELQSLEYLIELLTSSVPIKIPVNLSQWFQNVFEACWQTLEAFLNPEQDRVNLSFRSAEKLRAIKLDNPAAGVSRAKMVELGLQRASQQVVLVIRLTPAAPEIKIWVEVHPMRNQIYLPRSLHLMVLDENEVAVAVREVEATSTKNIQLQLSGERGELFSVKVALGDVSITETFVI